MNQKKIVNWLFSTFVVIGGLFGANEGLKTAAREIGTDNLCWTNMTRVCIATINIVALPWLIAGTFAGVILAVVLGLIVARVFGYRQSDTPETDTRW